MAIDEAVDSAGRYLLPVLPKWETKPFLGTHLSTAGYRATNARPVGPKPLDQRYHTNDSFWEGIIYNHLAPSTLICLDSCFILEWLPRAPGLYFTVDGSLARKEAQRYVEKVDDGVIVFNPHGKFSMLRGGVGNVRLRPRSIDGTQRYFMGASFNGTAHQGIPISMPEAMYQSIIEEISSRGAVNRNILGRLKFVPDEILDLYKGYTGVRQLYLEVSELQPPSTAKSRRMSELSVSVAVVFESSFEGHKGLYASYVNFEPGNNQSERDCVSWMGDKYVREKYQGVVVTDFDEQRSNFPDAIFSLEKVMDCRLQKNGKEIAYRLKAWGLGGAKTVNIIENIENMIDNSININDSTVETSQIGKNNRAKNSFTGRLNLRKLGPELEVLHSELQKTARTPSEETATAAVAEAKVLAEKGDKGGVMKALKRAGNWALETATKVGVTVAAKAIEDSIGIT